MNKLFTILLGLMVVIITTDAKAVTIFQTWESQAGWTKVLQSGGSTTIDIQPLGAQYVSGHFYRDALAGFSGLYTPLGSATIPGLTAGGNIPEFWMDIDIQYDAGQTSNTCFFGLFNSNGTNNNNGVSISWLGVRMAGPCPLAQGYPATISGTAFTPSPSSPWTSSSHPIERIKMHVYTYSGNTVMDVNVYTYDTATGSLTPAGTLSRYTILSSGQSLPSGLDLDSFGVRNTYSSVRDAIFKFDNMYFSTERPNEAVVPAPFGMTCTDSTGDFTGDCKVNIDDVAVIAAEWIRCAMIPARLCTAN